MVSRYPTCSTGCRRLSAARRSSGSRSGSIWSTSRRPGSTSRIARFDTFELAVLLRPGLKAYDLGSIARELGVGGEIPHRALADAELARAVFVALVEAAEQLPLETLAQVVRLAAPLDWPLKIDVRAGPTAPGPGDAAQRDRSTAWSRGRSAGRPRRRHPRRKRSNRRIGSCRSTRSRSARRSRPADRSRDRCRLRGSAGPAPDAGRRRERAQRGRHAAGGGRDRHREVAGVPAAGPAVLGRQRHARRRVDEHDQPPGSVAGEGRAGPAARDRHPGPGLGAQGPLELPLPASLADPVQVG